MPWVEYPDVFVFVLELSTKQYKYLFDTLNLSNFDFRLKFSM
jgi:hypothetical protein